MSVHTCAGMHASVYAHTPHVYRFPQRPEKGIDSPGLMSSCEQGYGCLEQNLGPLEEQQDLLTPEASLHSTKFTHLECFNFYFLVLWIKTRDCTFKPWTTRLSYVLWTLKRFFFFFLNSHGDWRDKATWHKTQWQASCHLWRNCVSRCVSSRPVSTTPRLSVITEEYTSLHENDLELWKTDK